MAAINGAEHKPDFLDPSIISNLRYLFSVTEFELREKQTGKIWERYRVPTAYSPELQDAINGIVILVESYMLACSDRWPVLGEWQANNVSVQRYGTEDGISRHRDFTKDVGLNVIITIQGRSIFEVFHGIEGPPWLRCVVRPGSLVLLRATDLVGKDTSRPYHQISGALEGTDRIALILRYERKTGGDNVHPLVAA